MYIFRADGNKVIGAGHLMRSLTIADELKKLLADDEKLVFMCADESSSSLIEKRGYDCVILETDYKDMESELAKIESYLGEQKTEDNTFLVDSYQITDGYIAGLRELGKVIVLDDMGEQVINADIVINYNAYASKDRYRELYGESDTKCYLGSRLIPVRPMFLNNDYKLKKKVSNVLITTGGGDVDGISGHILDVLSDDIDVIFHVVAGNFNPHIAELENRAEKQSNIKIHKFVEDMATLMKECDMAITAGGSTTYELCAVGLPFICFSYADNQEQVTEYMDEYGIGADAGAYHRNPELTLDNIKNIYKRYKDYYDIRKSHSDMGRELVDGKGARRMAEIIHEG